MSAHTTATLPIMAHLVLGYPNLPESLDTARQYIEAGVAILELQIPFSHPTADGPVITEACRVATQQGVQVRDCIQGIAELRAAYPAQEIMVMSYANRVYHVGFEFFMSEMKACGVQHIIIPDLPIDAAWWHRMRHTGVSWVPVLAANTPPARLQELLDLPLDFFYLMSDFKITGSGFSLHPHLQTLISKIRNTPLADGTKRRVGIGFGISTPEQARIVVAEADLAIIGSALIQAQKSGNLAEYLESLHQIRHETTHPSP